MVVSGTVDITGIFLNFLHDPTDVVVSGADISGNVCFHTLKCGPGNNIKSGFPKLDNFCLAVPIGIAGSADGHIMHTCLTLSSVLL